jgi:ketosteroid isomerase-like protein
VRLSPTPTRLRRSGSLAHQAARFLRPDSFDLHESATACCSGKALPCGILEQAGYSRGTQRSRFRADFTPARQLAGDAAVLDRFLDDLLVVITVDGTLASKSDDLSLHRSGRLRITRMDPSDRHLLHLGETSVVSVRMDAEAVMNGQPVTATLRYTRVWHKRSDGWRLVAGHMSTVSA